MKIILVLLISFWLVPAYAEDFKPKSFSEYSAEKIRGEADEDVKEYIILIKAFMAGVNKSKLTEDFAIFIFSMKTELVKAGFTEKQAMTFLSFSGQLLYEESQDD